MDPLEHLIGQEPDPQAYTGHGLRAPDPQLYTGQRRIVTPVIQGSGGGYLTPDYWGHVRSNAPDAPLATSSSQTLVSSTGTGVRRRSTARWRPSRGHSRLSTG
ncbi:MAG: hypothetical protein M5U26_08535 [Planctomycetota bacterium]|nr:hypothetical protein [Planctomycetota bacterium]